MKTSFYFVLWILIYPLLGLFHNTFINNNAFVIALIFVWGLSWLLNRLMPDTLAYERVSQLLPILEDVYTGNVASFKKRLVRDANIETMTAIYFIVSTIAIALVVFKAGVNDWIALIIFCLFTYGAISQSISFIRAKAALKSDPTPEQCMEIADKTYDLNYAPYYEDRNTVSYQDILSPKPRHFKAFNVFSIIIAVIAFLLGLNNIVVGIILMLSEVPIEVEALAVMYLMYGALAVFFGVKDFISCIHTKSGTTTVTKGQTT